MLLKDFYKISSIESIDAQKYRIAIAVDKNHAVFNGHFPGNPVIPGVCMLQIIKELTEEITKQPLVLQKMTVAKFTALINPLENPDLILELDILKTDDSLVKVKNTTIFNETIALKMNGIYKIKAL